MSKRLRSWIMILMVAPTLFTCGTNQTEASKKPAGPVLEQILIPNDWDGTHDWKGALWQYTTIDS